jgi:hypothetical protein
MYSDGIKRVEVKDERSKNPLMLRIALKLFRRAATWVSWFSGLFFILLNAKAISYMMSEPGSYYFKNSERDASQACISMLGIGYLTFLFLLCPMVFFIPFVARMTPCPRAFFRKSAKLIFITAASSMLAGLVYGFACFGSRFFS